MSATSTGVHNEGIDADLSTIPVHGFHVHGQLEKALHLQYKWELQLRGLRPYRLHLVPDRILLRKQNQGTYRHLLVHNQHRHEKDKAQKKVEIMATARRTGPSGKTDDILWTTGDSHKKRSKGSGKGKGGKRSSSTPISKGMT